ncbi:hypothetical protein [Ramlibacter sp.]|uniref:hypothetical protein n=1 Tax=Ramlibacter sp. TaxID=1917967 RepID=UPI002C93EA9C|nr:hypothetical protein [Ramlibacter sp.]HWI81983.1 hypothetical protein [Ramlibacter sp.]
MKRKIALALAIATAATLAVDANAKKPAPAKAQAKPAVETAVDVPPPSGSWEATPPPAEGYVWSAGYYEWKDGRYAWKAGEWVLSKPGMEYRQHKWVQRADGKWVLTGGTWVAPGENVAGKQ